MRNKLISVLPLLLPLVLQAQSSSGLQQFAFVQSPLVIHHTVQPQQPFTVVGAHGAILGSQDGSFEMWLMPVQILREAHLTARLQGYDAVIPLNELATGMDVQPDHTTITYSHAAITVRQHMFLPRPGTSGVSAVVLFEVHATRPAEISLTFTPSMTMEWPAPNYGPAAAEWASRAGGSGYVLRTNNPRLYGVVAMPGATHGDLRPYQERASETPAVLTFHYDPKADDKRFYPLLCGLSENEQMSGRNGEEAAGALLDSVLATTQEVPKLYRATADFYQHFFEHRLDATTPDPEFDNALRWAEIAIDQSQVPRPQGTGLTAGWLAAGSTARPGYGWFFGRDTLWSLYAVNSYGDFKLTRGALEFLLSQQREDGKIMHELSQTASTVDWRSLPYLYAAADSTPLLLMACEDYVRSSGDLEFLRSHWPEISKAYRFTRAHDTSGAMDNSEGTGWVEDWSPHQPSQEFYLVALDAQANLAFARMAGLMDEVKLQSSGLGTARTVEALMETYRSPQGIYRFSRNRDGSFEEVRSIFPAVAWWSGDLHPVDPEKTFADWESSHFTVDWGVRSVADDQAIYDPISYHRGTVWPLYTGWAAMAEYRTGRSLAGYEHLRSDVNLTRLQDPGAITELLSGEFYQPLARSSSHQLWSSAMLLSPAIRGLFGLRVDALNHRLTVAPQLPAGWNKVALRNVAIGDRLFSVHLERGDGALLVDVAADNATTLCLAAEVVQTPCDQQPTLHHTMRLPLPAVEVSFEDAVTRQGMESQHMHVLDEVRGPRSLSLTLEAPGGSLQKLTLYHTPAITLRVDGGLLQGDMIKLQTPAGNGYQNITVKIAW